VTIYLVDLEPIETRYTKQWQEHLPEQLQKSTTKDVVVISGPGELPSNTTPGMFLNFSATNIYKSAQMQKIAELFSSNKVKDGDYFLYTDAWNPTVIQLKYMTELLGINIKIGGLWHAGSYDKWDGLGRLIGNKPWVRYAEKSMYQVYDHNFFATEFHGQMFCEAIINDNEAFGYDDKIVRTGWPMEYLEEKLKKFRGQDKENLILFPHRIAPEKQVEIFRDLAKEMPEYKFVVCQDRELTKDEYHSLLGRAKLVFSANLQETLGISWYEGTLVDAIPMVPNRLSYTEMALEEFKYPSEWTTDFDAYVEHKELVKSKIVDYVENYNSYANLVKKQADDLSSNYFGGDNLYGKIRTG